MRQKLADRAQTSLEQTIALFQKLEKESCECAGGDPNAAIANANFTTALGHLLIAKGVGTSACMAMPGIEPRFGGK